MTDPLADFIARVDRLEERFKGDKYSQDYWMMPVDLLKAIRDELKRSTCPNTQLTLNFGSSGSGSGSAGR